MKKKEKIIILSIMSVLVIALASVGGIFLLREIRSEAPVEFSKTDIEWYDEGEMEFEISTAEQLREISTLSQFYNFKGQTLKLTADIVLNEGNAADWENEPPEQNWYPITGFAGTFDGQGHTISGMYGTSIDSSLGMFTNTKGSATIRDFRLVNSFFVNRSHGGTGSIIGSGGGTLEKVYSNAIVKSDLRYLGGLVGYVSDGTENKISNCWFDGQVEIRTEFGVRAGGIVGCASKQLTIEHCLNTGSVHSEKSSGGIYIGGLCGMLMSGTFYVKDSLNLGPVTTKGNSYYYAAYGRVSGGAEVFVEDVYATSESCGGGLGGAVSNSAIYGHGVMLPEKNLKGYGGYQWTSLNFDDYWNVSMDGAPMLKAFSEEVEIPEKYERLFNLDWYSANEDVYTLNTLADLYGFTLISSSNTFKEKTVKLGADIVANKGNASSWGKKPPELVWEPIKKFAGTFDGQGHTISGLYGKTDTKYLGLFARTMETSVVKNLKLKNSYFESTLDGSIYLGSITGYSQGTVDTVYSDAILVSTGAACGGIAGITIKTKKAVYKNCWFDGSLTANGKNARYLGGISGMNKADVSFLHCLNSGTITSNKPSGAAYTGGIAGQMTNGYSYVIDDCLNVGQVSAPIVKTYYGPIAGRLDNKSTAVVTNTYATKESCASSKLSVGTTSTLTGSVITVNEDTIKGLDGYKWTTLNFKNYWSAVEDETPVLTSFAKKKLSVAGIDRLIDVSWYDESKDTYTLDSVEDLYGFWILSGKTNFKGKTICLSTDIVINQGNATDWAKAAPEKPWNPISSFAGTFDGQGHTISGLYIKAGTKDLGFIGSTTSDAVIKNLKIKNSYLESTMDGVVDMGTFVGYARGAHENLYSDAIIVSTGAACGGIAGIVIGTEKSSFTNCWFDGSLTMSTANGRYGGGMVGMCKSDIDFTNCLNTADITTTLPKGNAYIGGLAGYLTNGYHFTFTACLNTGTITATTKTSYGTIFGRADKKSTVNLTDVYTMSGCGPVKGSVNDVTLTGEIKSVTKEKLTGDNAKESLTGLAFAGDQVYWITVKGNTPILKTFESEKVELDLPAVLGSKENPYIIDSREDLKQFYEDSLQKDFEGEYFRLDADIVWNEDPKAADAVAWNPIGINADGSLAKYFKGNFDGNGHTISGLYINTSSANGSGFIGRTGEGANISNLVLDKCSMRCTSTGNAFTGGVVGYVYGATIIENVYCDATIVSTGKITGGLVGVVTGTGSITLNDCWYDGEIDLGTTGTFGGGLIGTSRGAATINNCLNSGKISAKKSGEVYIGGLCGSFENSNTDVITDSVNVGIIGCTDEQQDAYGSLIGRISATTVVEFTDVYYVTDERAIAVGMFGTLEVTGTEAPQGTIPVTRDGIKGELALTAASGLSFVADKADDVHWMIVTDGMPKPDCFANIAANTHIKDLPLAPEEPDEPDEPSDPSEPDGSEENPYIIDSYADFEAFYNTAKDSNLAGVHYRLETDIEWKEDSWTPIPEFAGVLDGNGHVIKGIVVENTTKEASGMFRVITGATIKNLRIEDSSVTSNYVKAGAIAGEGTGTFEEVYIASSVTVATSASGNHQVGGYIGQVNDGTTTFTRCYNGAAVTSKGQNAGGFIGKINGAGCTVTITDCLNEGNIHANDKYAGGFVGCNAGSVNFDIVDSVSVGTVTAGANAGAMLGRLMSKGNVRLDDTYTTSSSAAVATIASGTELLYKENADEDFVIVTNLDQDNTFPGLDAGVWLKEKGYVPQLTIFVWKNLYGGTETDPYVLSTIKEWNEFVALASAESTEETYKKASYKLDTDIVLTTDFTPIPEFAGVLDGNGHAIKGIVVENTIKEPSGMFRKITGATIKNLRIEDSSVTSNYVKAGAIAGEGYGTFEEVYIASSVTVTTSASGNHQVGGYVGQVNDGTTTFTRCYNGATVTSKGQNAGGFIGKINGAGCTVTITDCLNEGSIKANDKYAGGFVGCNAGSVTFNIVDSVSVGTVTATSNAGAMVGRLMSSGSVRLDDTYTTISSAVAVATIATNCELLYKEQASEDFVIETNIDKDNAFPGLDSAVWLIEKGETPVLKCFE